MARTKTFEPDHAVDAALALFRLRGYEATSVDDLVQQLGIGRGSLYDTFGSKHALYLQALDRYLQQIAPAADAPLPERAQDAIAALLYQQVDDAVRAAPLGGCFLINSAVELAGRDKAVAARVKKNLAQGEQMIEQILARDAELALPADECRRLAQFFVSVIVSLRVRAKLNPNRALLRETVDLALSVLP